MLIPPPPGQPVTVDQGKSWSDTYRSQFYTVDQGSQLMPLDWFRALRRPDGTTLTFPYPFEIFLTTDLQVYDIVNATGVATLKTLGVDY